MFQDAEQVNHVEMSGTTTAKAYALSTTTISVSVPSIRDFLQHRPGSRPIMRAY